MLDESFDFLKNDYERAEYLQKLLTTFVTTSSNTRNKSVKSYEYRELRDHFFRKYNMKIPDIVRTHTNLDQFWTFIKSKFDTYQERREFISAEFADFLKSLNESNHSTISKSLSNPISATVDTNTINDQIRKGLNRVEDDPEGAITTARTILETTCKFIAAKIGVQYEENTTKLSSIYSEVSKQLKLKPDQHNEVIFKKILGGCSGIVNGLSELRNTLGDAHGKGSNGVKMKPESRHAELAVCLAGSVAIFLIKTYEKRSKSNCNQIFKQTAI